MCSRYPIQDRPEYFDYKRTVLRAYKDQQLLLNRKLSVPTFFSFTPSFSCPDTEGQRYLRIIANSLVDFHSLEDGSQSLLDVRNCRL